MCAMIFVVSLPMSRSSLFVQQSPFAPCLRSCASEEMKSAMSDVSYAASQAQIPKPIHSKAIVSRLYLFLTVMCTMTSYAAAHGHFRQDAHRRMASVLAHIRCAEECERGERARDHQTVNGEQLFMSVTSAECTEVEYATERYSESPPPDGTKTDKGDTANRKRRRSFELRVQVELDSSSDEAPTSSKCIYLREIHRQIDHLREIHRQIDHNEMLQRRLTYSTKLLRDAERIAIGEGNAPAPQAVRPLAPAMPNAPIPPLDWRLLCSSKCPGPHRLRMRPAKITRHKLYFQRTFLRRFRA